MKKPDDTVIAIMEIGEIKGLTVTYLSSYNIFMLSGQKGNVSLTDDELLKYIDYYDNKISLKPYFVKQYENWKKQESKPRLKIVK